MSILLLTVTAVVASQIEWINAKYGYKLEGGSTPDEGFAMLCNPNNANDCGTICDIGFVKNGWPKVFCLDMGYQGVVEAKYAKAAGLKQKTGNIAFMSPACGPPSTMETCRQDKNPGCDHIKDVYVKCLGPRKRVKFENGKTPYEGYAMMWNANTNTWGSICDIHVYKHGWPSVFCRELGYSYAVNIQKNKAGVAQVAGPHAFKCPACNPQNAVNMASCGKDRVQVCDHTHDVYVTCKRDYVYKLEGGKTPDEGYAMLCDKSNRRDCGTICDIGFVKAGWPKVFCLGLGYSDVIEAKYANKAGLPAKTGRVAFQSPACGPPSTMNTCGQDKNPVCDHNKDVYVKCKGPRNPTVKLVNGKTAKEGYAMMWDTAEHRWGSICDKNVFKHGWPSVFCKEIGLGHAVKIEKKKQGVQALTGPIAFKCPACNPDNAQNMATCGSDKVQICDHADDVYVTCSGSTSGVASVDNTGSVATSGDKVEDSQTTEDSASTDTVGVASVDSTGSSGDKVEESQATEDNASKVCAGECHVSSCQTGYQSAHRAGKEGQCDPDEQGQKRKCCFKKDGSVCAGECHVGSCQTGYQSAHRAGKEGKCDPDEQGQKRKCCFKKDASVCAGECHVSSCQTGYQSANRAGKEGKCDPDEQGQKRKCCFKKDASVCAGECHVGSECGEGYESAKNAGKEGKCDPDDQGQKRKCCFKKAEIENTCIKTGGQCEDASKCPSGSVSGKKVNKDGKCPQKGYRCCYKP